MPLVRSNSGKSFSYAPLNPPDIRTFSCADAATGQDSSVVTITNEDAFMIGFPRLRRFTSETLAHYACKEVAVPPILIFACVRFGSKADMDALKS
jgi:hypothetical protein